MDGNSTVESAFLESILSAQRMSAIDIARRHVDEHGLASFYEHIVTPALQEVGARWERNLITVADEHLATAIVQSAIASLYPALPWPPRTTTAVITCVEGERHELGARMAADLLELDGWRVFFTGGDTPTSALLTLCERAQPVFVGLSVSLTMHLPAARTTIGELRALMPSVKILVGGRALKNDPDPAALGADEVVATAWTAITATAAWRSSSSCVHA